MTNDETRNNVTAAFLRHLSFELRHSLDIQVAHVQRVVFDELPARLNHVAHQSGKHLIGIDSVVIVQIDLQQLALLRIHRGLEQFFRVHFAETFEPLDLHAAPADLQNLLKNLRNGEQRVDDGFFAFAFDQFEDRTIARGVVIDFQTFPRQLRDELLNRRGFVQLDQFAAAAAGRRWSWPQLASPSGKQFLLNLGVEQVQIGIFLVKFRGPLFRRGNNEWSLRYRRAL